MNRGLLIGLAILLALGAGVGGVVIYKNTRGFRNKNPGNLRYVASIKWQGQTGSDLTGYAVFDTMENGVRAMTKNLRTYIGRGLNTLNKIVPVYAPSHENPTAAYITFLVKKTGLAADATISDATLTRVVPAMIEFENGQALEPTVVTEGIRRAYVG